AGPQLDGLLRLAVGVVPQERLERPRLALQEPGLERGLVLGVLHQAASQIPHLAGGPVRGARRLPLGVPGLVEGTPRPETTLTEDIKNCLAFTLHWGAPPLAGHNELVSPDPLAWPARPSAARSRASSPDLSGPAI